MLLFRVSTARKLAVELYGLLQNCIVKKLLFLIGHVLLHFAEIEQLGTLLNLRRVHHLQLFSGFDQLCLMPCIHLPLHLIFLSPDFSLPFVPKITASRHFLSISFVEVLMFQFVPDAHLVE